MEQAIINDMDTFVRHHELLFNDGRIYQRETNGFMETRFVDVTEEVARAISQYNHHYFD